MRERWGDHICQTKVVPQQVHHETVLLEELPVASFNLPAGLYINRSLKIPLTTQLPAAAKHSGEGGGGTDFVCGGPLLTGIFGPRGPDLHAFSVRGD